MIVTPSCGALSARGGNQLSSPVCQYFRNRNGTLSSRGDAALMPEPQPINAKSIWLGFFAMRSMVDTGDHRYLCRVFGAVEIREIYESGMSPIFPVCDGNSPHRWASIHLGQRCGGRTNQRLTNGIGVWGFLTVRGGVDPRKLGFLPRLVVVLEIWNDFVTGEGTQTS